MVVYAGALYAYAAELAFTQRASRRERVAVPAGGATIEPEPEPEPEREREPQPRQGLSKAERVGRVAVALTVLAFGLHLASVAARGVSAGRAPWGNMFEFSVA